MYCSQCGFQLANNPKFCPSCGHTTKVNDQTNRVGSSSVRIDKPPSFKALTILIPTFLAVYVLNQLFYGACFKGYC